MVTNNNLVTLCEETGTYLDVSHIVFMELAKFADKLHIILDSGATIELYNGNNMLNKILNFISPIDDLEVIN